MFHTIILASKKASLNVSDIVITGWAFKGWLCQNDESYSYKLGINKDHCKEQLGETLASSLGRRLIGDEVLEYKLEKINNMYAFVSKCIN